ncbi:bifunctional 3-(3-hydroxy-phenyl)propionate/3-hydroxycinnamic acid hydroxylase [Tardiphaga sp.]|uniref:bifunctional 3-(3-hydroxy-phenyl)propionate/3-hydroxycinnamic acid hydroxylase MhpA n=1 Tax=Tardiphaga sp. TaxID=1926292 RepID=UPI0026035AAC|nr:bifunctional 3-(3-hydroxy-phenyl)propionate/3-hydroxycinnamic acid hydroxylase [Tardiphaga sp.]
MSNEPAAIADVAIVGLGPVGATLALLLGQAGLSVVVLEREAEPYTLPRAVHFDDEVMRVLQTIGVADEVLPHTHLSPGMLFVDAAGRRLLDWSRAMNIGPQGWHESYRFHQPDLERILRRKLSTAPSVTVLARRDVFAIDQDPDGATLRFEDLASGQLESVRARYVVGCDGARSLVRRLIGSTSVDLGFHERWLVIDCLLKRDKPELGEHSIQFCEPERPATYVRGVGQRRRWEITAKDSESNAALMEPAKIWQLLSRWITPEDADIERAAVYMFHSVVARKWRHERLLIAGDSAHQTPPFLGQGLCAGIRDASNLAWKLAAVIRGGAPGTLLDSYPSERIPHVTEYIELAVRLGGLINTRAVERALPGASAGDEPVRMSSIKPSLGRGLALSSERPVGTPAPQPRMPDGRLFDDRVGYGFALIARASDAAADDALRRQCQQQGVAFVAADEAGPLQAWLDQAGISAALVRPDRYVLAVAETSADAAGLLTHALRLSPSADRKSCAA